MRTYIATLTGHSFKLSTLYLKSQTRRLQDHKHHRFADPATRALMAAVYGDGSTPLGVRTAALIGWHGLLRVSEYTVGPKWQTALDHRMLMRDYQPYSDTNFNGFRLYLRHSKSDRFNAGNWHYFQSSPAPDPLCPVRAMSQYMAAHPFLSDSSGLQPLFAKPSNRGAKPVTRDDITAVLKKWASSAGLEPAHISTHSLRVGGAYQLADARVPLDEICQRGRWSSERWEEIVLMYTRMSSARMSRLAAAMATDVPSTVLGRR